MKTVGQISYDGAWNKERVFNRLPDFDMKGPLIETCIAGWSLLCLCWVCLPFL